MEHKALTVHPPLIATSFVDVANTAVRYVGIAIAGVFLIVFFLLSNGIIARAWARHTSKKAT